MKEAKIETNISSYHQGIFITLSTQRDRFKRPWAFIAFIPTRKPENGHIHDTRAETRGGNRKSCGNDQTVTKTLKAGGITDLQTFSNGAFTSVYADRIYFV